LRLCSADFLASARRLPLWNAGERRRADDWEGPRSRPMITISTMFHGCLFEAFGGSDFTGCGGSSRCRDHPG
jgi:hypothetical protein